MPQSTQSSEGGPLGDVVDGPSLGDGNTNQLYADYNQPFVRIPMSQTSNYNGMSQGRIDHCSCGLGGVSSFFGTTGLESQ